MKTKSILSNSFKNFIITTFLLIEIAGGIFGTYRYISEAKRIEEHHRIHNIGNDSLVIRLQQNKDHTIFQFLVFSFAVLVAAVISNAIYIKRLKRVKSNFNDFAELLANSVKKHKPLMLNDTLNYSEFQKIANSLNEVLNDIYYQENYNSLTKLPKKQKFLLDIQELYEKSDCPIIVSYIYLKDYQNLLKSRSFDLADKIILELASRFSSFSTTILNSKIAKISGNGDFLLAFPCIDEIQTTFNNMAIKLHECFSESINFGSDGIYEQSIGVGFSVLTNENYNQIINDTYKAALLSSVQKDTLYCDYSDEVKTQIDNEAKLENDLKRALEKGELDVYYQAKIGANDNLVKGAEALIRWKRNDKFENTEKFIRIAEKTDLIIKLEKFVIAKVFQEIQVLKNKGINIPISINISAKHLHHKDMINYLLANVKKYDINPSLIDIEITERYRLNSSSETILEKLKAIGFLISIDDFGKDYSSLSYINHLPIDTIKIDKSFIDGLNSKDCDLINENSKAIIIGIIKIAKTMNKRVVAEGVETLEQVNILKQLGCDELQGFYYHKGATPINEFINIYKNKF
ncbi:MULTISPECIES: EAL domain-containing protein [unclassified Campylobacter]|uniref:EAL domain-containing protein n=1 Tax=unclassified Campylobacter TaxID=2593542 RepID=UPI001BDA4AFA|nr:MULTISPECIES: EAL domain-containing protein [unclassified Campylobacter]MBZ7975636.1 EAL domain-containing protein [Campylobacter sp. RM12637]MBZ7979467.1 EAL domain-containing protein [Campylobacter sp. RM12642]MBZ7980961.1 EAL domain-containing protein [Campylobacter sp. RM12640]MBZ7988280.1 EAL domain-containing protein [Campylobacter sp. RM12635]MBZ7992560.1 EAL domain-containing protein [Campylobacter sp. RM9333]MBZ8006670.1 EAL domain-containing protein [Campylobacter sp. RM9334]